MFPNRGLDHLKRRNKEKQKNPQKSERMREEDSSIPGRNNKTKPSVICTVMQKFNGLHSSEAKYEQWLPIPIPTAKVPVSVREEREKLKTSQDSLTRVSDKE